MMIPWYLGDFSLWSEHQIFGFEVGILSWAHYRMAQQKWLGGSSLWSSCGPRQAALGHWFLSLSLCLSLMDRDRQTHFFIQMAPWIIFKMNTSLIQFCLGDWMMTWWYKGNMQWGHNVLLIIKYYSMQIMLTHKEMAGQDAAVGNKCFHINHT